MSLPSWCHVANAHILPGIRASVHDLDVIFPYIFCSFWSDFEILKFLACWEKIVVWLVRLSAKIFGAYPNRCSLIYNWWTRGSIAVTLLFIYYFIFGPVSSISLFTHEFNLYYWWIFQPDDRGSTTFCVILALWGLKATFWVCITEWVQVWSGIRWNPCDILKFRIDILKNKYVLIYTYKITGFSQATLT